MIEGASMSRSSAATAAEQHAKVLRRRADGLEIIAKLMREHLTGEDEQKAWDFITSIPYR